MFEILKNEIIVSDKVKLYLTSGKEVEVEIVEIGEKYLLVLNLDGTQSRFFESLIGGWDLISRKQVDQSSTSQTNEKQLYLDETTHIEKKEIENKFGLKIIGKIDLDKIEPKRKRFFESKVEPDNSTDQIQLQKQNTLSQHIREHQMTFTSLQNLQELKDKINADYETQKVPANAIIKIWEKLLRFTIRILNG